MDIRWDGDAAETALTRVRTALEAVERCVAQSGDVRESIAQAAPETRAVQVLLERFDACLSSLRAGKESEDALAQALRATIDRFEGAEEQATRLSLNLEQSEGTEMPPLRQATPDPLDHPVLMASDHGHVMAQWLQDILNDPSLYGDWAE